MKTRIKKVLINDRTYFIPQYRLFFIYTHIPDCSNFAKPFLCSSIDEAEKHCYKWKIKQSNYYYN